MAGDDLILEYAAAPSGEMPRLKISGIGYGYNHLSVVSPGSDWDWKEGYEPSGPCMVNINCEEGTLWQKQKKGVCHMVQLIDGMAYICSGSLVNNTAKDKKPYILSAFHCSQTTDGSATATSEELNQWVFIFNKEHIGYSNDSEIADYHSTTMVGCTRKAITPAIDGKGNLISMDGVKWKTLQASDDLDFNFILSFIVSSEEGELPAGKRSASISSTITLERSRRIASVLRSELSVSNENNVGIPQEFPEITGYNVYRDQAKLADLPSSQTQYTDKNAISDSYQYAVTTQYNKEESRAIEAFAGGTVDIEDVEENPIEIFPIVFRSQIHISNSTRVDRLDIYSANGKLMNSIRKPGEIVDTAALPQGMYVFLLYTDKGAQTIQAIRDSD
ncbi:T9SS type A sorting domain-containing protein [Parabacteroides distasonis]|uniref:T9SS type A sorting domain-containing protein n=2 Tax=Parabacteroides distasonis TaxID=823 RepID=UPI001FF0D67A|nr:T9SS type A sorting domain-containing protein [Parabacteroides distasonis]